MTGFIRSAAFAALLALTLSAGAQAQPPGGNGKWSKATQEGAAPAVTAEAPAPGTSSAAPPVANADGTFTGAAGVAAKEQAPAAAGQDPAALLENAVTPAPGTAVPDPAAAVAPVAEAPPDPCAPYAASAVNYEACVDRMKKIQRMRDASTQREEDLKAYYQKLENKTAPKKVSETPAP